MKPIQEIVLLGAFNARLTDGMDSRVMKRFGKNVLNNFGERLFDVYEIN